MLKLVIRKFIKEIDLNEIDGFLFQIVCISLILINEETLFDLIKEVASKRLTMVGIFNSFIFYYYKQRLVFWRTRRLR